MTDPRLIGVLGKKRAGKDTFAGYLEPYGYARFAFADPLKVALLHTNPYLADARGGRCRLADMVAQIGWEAAKTYPEVRRLLQEFGTSVRMIDRDFWVRATLGPATESGRAVITDVRYPNEARAVVQAGGILVRVVRPGLVSTDTHESETALDDYPVSLEVSNVDRTDLEAAAAVLVRGR